MTLTELKTHYNEALRYMDNAEETLKKTKKEDGFFKDAKYVKTACGTAYNGVLIAIDALFEYKKLHDLPKNKRKSIDYYKRILAQHDRLLLNYLKSVYQVLHLDGYYDGLNDSEHIKLGFKKAYAIIESLNHKPLGKIK